MKIAVLDDYQYAAREFADWSAVEARGTVDVFHECIDAAKLTTVIAPYDVIVAMRERTRFPADVLAALPRLRLLVSTGPRNAAIDVAAANAQGITVCWTGGLLRPTTELTWGLIHALARNIVQEHNALVAGRFQTTVGVDLEGSTLGILGLGALGAQVAEVAKAYGMEVIAWSQHLTDERAAEVGVRRVAKDELFARADFLTIHMVLSERSRGLVDEAALRLMKPGAYLVNTSRGPIVDEDALVRALRDRWIAGAGLDVFDVEPLPASHALVRLPNVVLTPHLGYVTRGVYEIFFANIVENILAWDDGSPIRVSSPV